MANKRRPSINISRFLLAPLDSQNTFGDVPVELLFNIGPAVGTRRMLADILKWILFHTRLNSEQHFFPPTTLAAIV